MAVMMGKLYSALRAANVAEDKAREAAEEAAQYENRFDGIEARIAKVEADLRLLKWMVGTNTAVTLVVLGLVLQILLHGMPVPPVPHA